MNMDYITNDNNASVYLIPICILICIPEWIIKVNTVVPMPAMLKFT